MTRKKVREQKQVPARSRRAVRHFDESVILYYFVAIGYDV